MKKTTRATRLLKVGSVTVAAGGLMLGCVPKQPSPTTTSTTDTTAPAVLAITTATADAPMTPSALSETPVTADCPAGSKLLGGGIRLVKLAGGNPTNGLKVNGLLPTDAAGVPAADGSSGPASWTAVGGFGGQGEAGDQVTSFALCATSVVSSVTVASTQVAGIGSVTATCPSGSRLVGGGARTTPAGNGSLKPIGTFPSDSSGVPAANGAVNPDSWTAVSNTATGDVSAKTTSVFAMCAVGLPNTVTVARAETRVDPYPASTPVTQSVSCPAGDVLIGGGARIDNNGAVPQQGLHLTGAFPSDTGGAPTPAGSAPDAWTVIAQSGGQAAAADVRAFALCAAG